MPLLPFIEGTRIVRRTSSLPDVLRLSSPKPRLRYAMRLALKPDPNSLLCSIAGSSSPFSCPNFLNCSSTTEWASIFADYLRSLFSVSQPTALRIRARGDFFELRRATWPVEFHSSFCFPLLPR